MEPSCQSDTFFEIKTEEEEMEFELEDLHHSIDIKDEGPVLEFQQNEECKRETIEKSVEPADIETYIPYKTCMVPKCTNTTKQTPEKIFISVPKFAEVRRKWCIAMNRDERKPVSNLSTLYCCGDHFTLKDDLENYWQYKLIGSVKKLRLHKGVIPHKFHCQEQALPEGGASVKRRRFEEIVAQPEIELAVHGPKPGCSVTSECSQDYDGNLSEIEEPAVDVYLPYKSCMVPKCISTTVKTPEKIFISVPKNAEVRRKWCMAMKRDERKPVSIISALYCCEDHFTLKDDLENYWQYKLAGNVKKLRLNKGVIPHKFDCQVQALPEGGASVKHRRFVEIVEEAEIGLAVDDSKPNHSASSSCAKYYIEDSKDDDGNLSEIEKPAVIDIYLPYKTCMVPKCANTTVQTPEKIFISVPKKAEVRRKWCIAMKRDGRPLSTLSSLYCCEDHFTLEDDLSNYWQHKLIGDVKKFRLKKGVVPHKFHCQQEYTP